MPKKKSRKRSAKGDKELTLSIEKVGSGEYKITPDLSSGYIEFDPDKVSVEINEGGKITVKCPPIP